MSKPARKSMSFQGAIIQAIPGIVFLLHLMEIEITADQLGEAVTAIAATVGPVMAIWGTLRRSDISGVV